MGGEGLSTAEEGRGGDPHCPPPCFAVLTILRTCPSALPSLPLQFSTWYGGAMTTSSITTMFFSCHLQSLMLRGWGAEGSAQPCPPPLFPFHHPTHPADRPQVFGGDTKQRSPPPPPGHVGTPKAQCGCGGGGRHRDSRLVDGLEELLSLQGDPRTDGVRLAQLLLLLHPCFVGELGGGTEILHTLPAPHTAPKDGCVPPLPLPNYQVPFQLPATFMLTRDNLGKLSPKRPQHQGLEV